MRTTIISIFLLLAGLTLMGQISLEHSYSYSGTLTEIDEGEFKYFVMDVPMKECRIYNEDHSLYKTINLQVPSGYFLTDIKFVSRKIFNSDDNIELLFIYYKADLINSQYVYTYGMKVVNELGTVLLNLSDGGFAELKTGSNGTKLLAYRYIWYESYYLVYTNIYALGGTTKSASAQLQPSVQIYPNPTDETLYVELSDPSMLSGGNLMISDISGRQVLSQPVHPGTGTLSIGTGKMSPGTYILHMVTNDGIRISEKIEKR
jgi:hypothetical protein